MSKKRKDKKGRVLEFGEYQRADGRYEYRYEYLGKSKCLYSWRLVESDPTPQGKRIKPALRTLKKQLEKDLADYIDINSAEKLTLNDLTDKLFEVKRIEWSPSTLYTRSSSYNKHVRKSLGKKRINQITHSTLLSFYSQLLIESHLSWNSINFLHTTISNAFNLAVQDNLIRRSPCLSLKKKKADYPSLEHHERNFLTKDEEERFINYLLNHGNRKYISTISIVIVILYTGLRIGEVVALQWDDCDFDNLVINVRRNYIYYKNSDGKGIYEMTSPKSISGIRTIPMLPIVETILKSLKNDQEKYEPTQKEIMGQNNFVFLHKNKPIYRQAIYLSLRKLISDYNQYETECANLENRSPNLLPSVSPHDLRRTFATRLAENNVNLKVMQSLLGHASINTTYDVYVQTSMDEVKSELNRCSLSEESFSRDYQNFMTPKLP